VDHAASKSPARFTVIEMVCGGEPTKTGASALT